MAYSPICLFDSPENHTNLLPLSFTRPLSELRIGIFTVREKWEKLACVETRVLTAGNLASYVKQDISDCKLFVNSSFIPGALSTQNILELKPGEKIMWENEVLALATEEKITSYQDIIAEAKKAKNGTLAGMILPIYHPWDIFVKNAQAMQWDFDQLKAKSHSQGIDSTNQLIGSADNLLIEPGAKITGAILNAQFGPIYIDSNAEIMEGSVVRGPLAMCEHSVLKMGTKIYGATTLGPYCKVGGEVNNSVLLGYSNKGHDGFLGNSVIGEWCNLGADTNTSNLKNNYGNVRSWNYAKEQLIETGLQFNGLTMGDHSKTGINTMLNTGTVVGVCANIFGGDFPPKFIPSYSWGGAAGFQTFRLEKAFEVAERMMMRREKVLSATDKAVLKSIFEQTAKYRQEYHNQ